MATIQLPTGELLKADVLPPADGDPETLAQRVSLSSAEVNVDVNTAALEATSAQTRDNVQTAIARLEAIRDQAPATGYASEGTLASIDGKVPPLVGGNLPVNLRGIATAMSAPNVVNSQAPGNIQMSAPMAQNNVGNYHATASGQALADGHSGANTPTNAPQLLSGSTYNQQRDTSGEGDTRVGLGHVPASAFVWNGGAWDRERSNLQAVGLASASRTATTNTPNITNYNARGLNAYLDITAIGTGSLTVRVFSYSPVAGVATPGHMIAASAAITAVGRTALQLYPGASGTVGEFATVAGRALARAFFIQVLHADASAWTYSLGYALIL